MTETPSPKNDHYSFRWGINILDDRGGVYIYGFMLRNYAAIGVTEEEFICILELASFAYESERSQGSHPSLARIAERMGKDLKTVRRYVRALEEKSYNRKKLLTVKRRVTPTGSNEPSVYNFSGFATACLIADAKRTAEEEAPRPTKTRKAPARDVDSYSFRWGINILDDRGGLYVYGFMLRHYAELGVAEEELICLLQIASFAYDTARTQGSIPPLTTIAERMGKQYRSVRRYVSALEARRTADDTPLLVVTRRLSVRGDNEPSHYDFSGFAQACLRADAALSTQGGDKNGRRGVTKMGEGGGQIWEGGGDKNGRGGDDEFVRGGMTKMGDEEEEATRIKTQEEQGRKDLSAARAADPPALTSEKLVLDVDAILADLPNANFDETPREGAGSGPLHTAFLAVLIKVTGADPALQGDELKKASLALRRSPERYAPQMVLTGYTAGGWWFTEHKAWMKQKRPNTTIPPPTLREIRTTLKQCQAWYTEKATTVADPDRVTCDCGNTYKVHPSNHGTWCSWRKAIEAWERSHREPYYPDWSPDDVDEHGCNCGLGALPAARHAPACVLREGT